MKTTTSTHKIPGYGSTLRTAKRLTEQAARLVNRSVPGTMCDVEVILTNERGMADLMTAADIALAGSADRRALTRAQRDAKRTARQVQGAAIPRPDGTALVLINADRHPTPAEFAVTLVHELVHVMQFSRKDVRERIVADLRDRLGIECQSRRHGATLSGRWSRTSARPTAANTSPPTSSPPPPPREPAPLAFLPCFPPPVRGQFWRFPHE